MPFHFTTHIYTLSELVKEEGSRTKEMAVFYGSVQIKNDRPISTDPCVLTFIFFVSLVQYKNMFFVQSTSLFMALTDREICIFIPGSSPGLFHSRQSHGHLHTLQPHKSVSLRVLPPLRTRVWDVQSKRRMADNTSRG